MTLNNPKEKKKEIILKIKENIDNINHVYRKGPSLYFYQKVLDKRERSKCVSEFINNRYNMELLYSTLLSWDMNSRGAKMKYFTNFKDNILDCEDHFNKLETLLKNKDFEYSKKYLEYIYDDLDLMETNSKLVSNSKMLHYLFPNYLMPMDRTNTLTFFFGNTNESKNKYLELTNFCFSLLNFDLDWEQYIDKKWNRYKPKVIDNAIILIMGKSTTS